MLEYLATTAVLQSQHFDAALRRGESRTLFRQGALGQAPTPGETGRWGEGGARPGKMAPPALLRPFSKLLAPARIPSGCECPSLLRPTRPPPPPAPVCHSQSEPSPQEQGAAAVWTRPAVTFAGLRPGSQP